MTTLRPLSNHVIVRPFEPAEHLSPGGIIIPDTVKGAPTKGTVVAVGPGERDDQGNVHTPDIKVNANILYAKYAGHEIDVNGETLLVMRESDIYCELVDAKAKDL